MKAFIIDVDGTVADLRHRLHYLHERDQVSFEKYIPDDLPIWPIIEIVRALHAAGYAIIFTSGRAEHTREVTLQWFMDYGVPYTALYMRANDDRRPDHVVKRQLLLGIQMDGYEIVAVLDDRQSVVDMWREEGLTCLQCAVNSENNYQTPEGFRPILTLLVGPSGAGKTTWVTSSDAVFNFGIDPQHVVATDRIRMDYFGDLRIDHNDQVHSAMHAVTKTRLKAGLPVVVDATNIRTKDRIEVVQLSGGVCPVRYIVIDRPLHEKIATGGWRLNVKFNDGKNLIEKHDATFRANIKAIMTGDNLPIVTVFDKRIHDTSRQAAA